MIDKFLFLKMDRLKCIEFMSKYLVLYVLNRYECIINFNRLNNL